MENKDKLVYLKEGLEILKKYDNNSQSYINELLDGDVTSLEEGVSPELFNELVHNNVSSYIDVSSNKNIKK